MNSVQASQVPVTSKPRGGRTGALENQKIEVPDFVFCLLTTLSTQKLVWSAGLAPAVSCSQGRRVGCYTTTR